MIDARNTILRLGCLVAPLLLAAAGSADAPVADAAMRGDVEAVRQLVAEGVDVNTPQGDGTTALHWAAEKRRHGDPRDSAVRGSQHGGGHPQRRIYGPAPR